MIGPEGSPVSPSPPPSAPATATESAAALPAILREIRFEQTLFSLPFALLAMLLAAKGWPAGITVVWILVALIGARSAAMAINRLADAAIDARNPRTQDRALPSGRVSRRSMTLFAAAALALFLFAAWQLNPLCLALAPVALLFLVGYSWTKRFTALCHLILGATLGIAPLGAWAAVRGTYFDPSGAWDWTPWLLAFGVLTWVAGFDVIYACPDATVDRGEGLRSIPRVLGERKAFVVAQVLHGATLGFLAAAGLASADLGPAWWGGLALGALILAAEHVLVRPGNYARMGIAFFRLNAVFGGVLLLATALDVFEVI